MQTRFLRGDAALSAMGLMPFHCATRHVWLRTAGSRFFFLFPLFMAPKEEAGFHTSGPEARQAAAMKDGSRQKDKERKSRLSLFLAKSSSHENVSAQKKTASDVSPEAAQQWSCSFDELLKSSDGVETFSRFLKTEFSEENMEFWLACEEFKSTDSETKLLSRAKSIYSVFIDSDAPKEVNIDHNTKVVIRDNIAQPTRSCFEAAQLTVYSLMKKDSYPRFLTSDLYLHLTGRRGPGALMFRRRSRSCVFSERGEATT